jgi:hypothetical protein
VLDPEKENRAMPDLARATCVICGSRQLQPLLNLAVDGVSHGAPGHVFTFDYDILALCEACGHGQLEKYSHDCFHYEGDEDWDMYWWYALSPTTLNRLRDLLVACPDRLNAKCDCALHRSLRESGERLWGGVKHAVDPAGKITFAWVVTEERPEQVTFQVDQQNGTGQVA